MIKALTWVDNTRTRLQLVHWRVTHHQPQGPTEHLPEAHDKAAVSTQLAAVLALLEPTLAKGLRFAGQCLILYLLFVVGTILTQAFSLPLPGNLVGMLLLLLLLSTGIIRPIHLQDVAVLVVQHLNFFFPFVVGLMAWATLFAASGIILGISLGGSAVVGLITAGLIAQWIVRHGGPTDAS